MDSINSWFEEELRQDYSHDRTSVDSSWKQVFDQNGSPAPQAAPVSSTPAPAPAPTAAMVAAPAPVMQVPEVAISGSEELMPLRGAASKIAENMATSISIPLATSQRIIPVKVVDENRRLINHHRGLLGKSKVSFTHIIGWAIIQSAKANPAINHAFTQNAAGELFRIVKKDINFGLAVDVAGKNGARNLVVPNIKKADAMTFSEYMAAFDSLVAKSRTGKLGLPDFQGTSISLTNPGTVGTMASMPRLMVGQGAIVAVGAMDYPAEYRGVSADKIAALGISKVMSITCTYDHRIIQGAESGMFLGKIQSLLDGADGFYDEIFEALKVPYNPIVWVEDKARPAIAGATVVADPEPSPEIVKEAAVIRLIHSYRVRGHLMADLDPLGGEPAYNPDLDPLTYGLNIWDMDRPFYTGNLAPALGGRRSAPLRDIIDALRATYCGKIGSEYMYIQDPKEVNWLQQQIEPRAFAWPLPKEQKVRVLSSLYEGEEFEQFLHKRFVGQKRFSLEGAETAIPILKELTNVAAETGAHEIVIGMAHRGRLNILANIVGKPTGQIFSEFEGNIDAGSIQGSGDVKYHLGASGVRHSASGKEIVVSLASNPSHLEAVNPVVEGMVRAKQERLNDKDRSRVIPVVIHGDAAFIGQGVVAETLNLSLLPGYSTGGTIHLVINNQIGFTTLPTDSRSTPYATDIARMIQAPIFHVNGDDPEASVRVLELAYQYRQAFHKDVVIDMICYRRHGHNEGDDPGYTQPVMYRKIEAQPTVATQYTNKLVAEKTLAAADAAALRKKVSDALNSSFDHVKASGPWVLQPRARQIVDVHSTAIDTATLHKVVDGITFIPSNFNIHPKLEGFVKKRRDILASNGPIDWAYGEALAFGSLVLEGNPVRLSGQDCGRGTFSQRHLVFIDHENDKPYIPLQHMSPDQAKFDVYNSSLSEFGVLGFEYGYSVADPHTLTLWEAQFGDFSNGAQIIIDQFITTAEQKWGQESGLVMLLPHGYEGQGPEHSSARIERFTTLCAENNIRLANCTTPAQYFHILRRQVVTERKPLVLFTPKSLLRNVKAVSSFQEITNGAFREVIGDNLSPSQVRKVVFCTGKVYYDLLAARDAKHVEDVALVRVEQFYPFPSQQVADVLARYSPGVKVAWCQEEPRNMGAWRFVSGRFREISVKLDYVGRPSNASPAAGSAKRHAEEQNKLVAEALAV